MPKRNPFVRQTGWRMSYEAKTEPMELPQQIAAICPSCDHPTLYKFPDVTDVTCGFCKWRTPFRDSMPINDHKHEPVVYYMRMSELVKIGTTTDIYARRMVIQPQGVMVVEYGSYDLERRRHREFVADHSHGEWFYLREILANHIVRLREDFEREQGEPVDKWIARTTRPSRGFAVLAD